MERTGDRHTTDWKLCQLDSVGVQPVCTFLPQKFSGLATHTSFNVNERPNWDSTDALNARALAAGKCVALMATAELRGGLAVPFDEVEFRDRLNHRGQVRAGELGPFRYTDKDWTMCDAISFAVLDARHVQRAFTFDRHFRQYGRVEVLGLTG